MGFKKPQKTYKLVFEDEEYEGLEVRTKGLPLGSFVDSFTKIPNVNNQTKLSDLSKEDRSSVVSMFEEFASVLLEWNLEEEDGTPVPATLEGLYQQDIDFAMKIIEAWMTAVAGINGPLDGNSTSGSSSLAASLPMEPLSESRAS